jgi:uncharacterized membrane protein
VSDLLYVIAVYVHILTIVVWIGAMLFEDPQSVRMTSRLAHRMGGIGWYAQPVLWTTGLYMLQHRGVAPADLFSRSFVSSDWGRAMWVKIILVLVLLGFQVWVGNKPSKLVYGYLLVSVMVVGISVLLVRPLF